MKQTLHQTLHQQLVQLRGRAKAWLEGEDPEGFYAYGGLCHNLTLDELGRSYLRDLMARWPGGSGYRFHPVPHPVNTPWVAHLNASAEEKWNPEFEYARNRWALLEWLIEQTQHQPEEPQP